MNDESRPLVVYPDADPDDRTRLTAERLQSLESRVRFEVHYGRPASDDEYAARVEGAAGILLGWDLPAAVMAGMERLKVISFTGTGVAKFVDLDLANSRGITVCNSPGYADNTVAEHALALLLAACRHVPRLDADLRFRRWNQSLTGTEVRGKTVGIVGFGGIGQRFAEICQALGMQVLVWTRNPDGVRTHAADVEFVTLEGLLEASDFVSVHVAQTAETEDLIDARALARMKPGAILVNTARGEIVNEAALAESLRAGHLGAAALDVFTQEPLPAGHPLCRLENVVLSPHAAYRTPESTDVLYDIAIANLVAHFDGRAQNVVTVSH